MKRKGFSPYGPSKAALESMSYIWAQELEGTGITLNMLLPGGANCNRNDTSIIFIDNYKTDIYFLRMNIKKLIIYTFIATTILSAIYITPAFFYDVENLKNPTLYLHRL